jgi:hypothetical protein
MARVDEALDDVLGDPLPVEHGHSYCIEPDYLHRIEPDHPHRTPLGWKRERRGGSVPPRPAHCLSPVRQVAPGRHADPAAR